MLSLFLNSTNQVFQMKDAKKWILRSYLRAIKFGHLILITLLGIWPCYYDYNTQSYKTTWYLRFYSLTILASITALLINTSITLYEDSSQAHPSDIGGTVALMLATSTVLVLVMIYLIQIKKVEQINSVVENGMQLFEQICSPTEQLDWSDFLKRFTLFILLNGSLMCDMTIGRISFLSPKAAADFSLIFFYSIPNIILCVIMSVFFCGLSMLHKYFCMLNEELLKIADDEIFDIFNVRKIPNYQRMKTSCILSDKIDNISKLHFKLCRLTSDFCDVFALQYLVCNSFTVFLLIFKLFLDFLFIRRNIVNKNYNNLLGLIWVVSINIASSIVDLSSVAGVCSKIKSKYREAESLTHKMFHSPNIDSRFMKSIEVLSIQLTQNEIKLSPYGLYEIDYTLVFSIVSAVFSYLIILIQFELAGEKPKLKA